VNYEEFLRAKVTLADRQGIDVDPAELSPCLKPHQRDIVLWALSGGRRAIFAAFGLGKTLMQLEIARLIVKHTGGRFLIVAPLGVRQEFIRDGVMLGLQVRFIRRIEEAEATGVYITNYETVRDEKLDPRHFIGSSLDEAAVLRGFGGSKTFRNFMRLFAGDDRSGTRTEGVKYRFVATATPSPNDYIELLAYSAYLDVMDVGQAKTRFFKRDSTKADVLTIHPHKEREFWLWCASWAIFIERPSDLGYSDAGYSLPELDIRWHELPSDHDDAGHEAWGQGRLLKHAAVGVVDSAREKRESLPQRIDKLLELRAENPQAHRIIWHDLEAERHAIEKAIPGVASVWGAQDLDEREQLVADFADGLMLELAAKPVMLGSGCNLQRHCHWAIFLGIGFKFADFIQAIHRIHRFLQTRQVRIDLIYTEAEREVRRILEQKWQQHNEQRARMTAIIKEYGMSQAAIAQALQRSIGVERIEVTGEGWTAINNDTVTETAAMESESVHLILTSVPFSTQYEYTPSYNDFGHTDSNAHFWQQMDFLTPELFRVLKPGRICCIHVKDRIVPGGLTGLGFQTVYPFHADAIAHFTRHGFGYMGMKTIVTDVVRENNQTYRLGWTEQCKDGTKMGVGMPEYLLIFRKPPTSTEKSYADEPVIKDKGQYSRSRWQIDAHAFARSNGNRLLRSEELDGLTHEQLFKLFKDYSLHQVYDYEHHVRVGEALEAQGRLPVTFMLLQPQSWSDEVWADVTRMLTLNGAQSAAGREMHLCPMQFDIADRAITQFTMPGELVFDPFGGLMTVPYRALHLKRRGRGHELNARYFFDGVQYLKAKEAEVAMPTLFDLDELADLREAA
jgi:DNA modification methylase